MKITEYMKDAVSSGKALAAFNAPGFDAMRTISYAAAELNAPVIIQTSSRLVQQHGPKILAEWFKLSQDQSGAQSFLHLDHCSDHKLIQECVLAGWDMVMFDGSHMPLDDNISQSRLIANFAHANGVAVEGEVGAIGGEEDGFEAEVNYASDEEVTRLAHESGIDCIAVGFGNVHGDYANKGNLRWDIYDGASGLAKLPLVLHGGSGLTDAEFCRAIRAGTAKINISTELKKAYVAAVEDARMSGKLASSPSTLHDTVFDHCHRVAYAYISKFQKIGELAL